MSHVRAGITVFVWASAQELSLLPIDVTCAVDCRLTDVILVLTLIRVSAYLTFRLKDTFCAYLCLCLSQFKFQYHFQSIINIISEKSKNTPTTKVLNFWKKTKQTLILLKFTSIAEVSSTPFC